MTPSRTGIARFAWSGRDTLKRMYLWAEGERVGTVFQRGSDWHLTPFKCEYTLMMDCKRMEKFRTAEEAMAECERRVLAEMV